MKLRCKTCGTVFAIGSRGIKAARERCLEHIRLKACGPEMVPINPPVGLTYVGEFGAPGYSNAPEVIYDEFSSTLLDGLAVAVENDAKIVVNRLSELPEDWVKEVEEKVHA